MKLLDLWALKQRRDFQINLERFDLQRSVLSSVLLSKIAEENGQANIYSGFGRDVQRTHSLLWWQFHQHVDLVERQFERNRWYNQKAENIFASKLNESQVPNIELCWAKSARFSFVCAIFSLPAPIAQLSKSMAQQASLQSISSTIQYREGSWSAVYQVAILDPSPFNNNNQGLFSVIASDVLYMQRWISASERWSKFFFGATPNDASTSWRIAICDILLSRCWSYWNHTVQAKSAKMIKTLVT